MAEQLVQSPFQCPPGTVPVPVGESCIPWRCLLVGLILGYVLSKL